MIIYQDMQDDVSKEVLEFCKKELEHLRLEQEYILHELSEYRDEKLGQSESV